MRFKHISSSANSWDGVYVCHVEGTTWAVYEIYAWEDIDRSAVARYGTYNVVAGFVDTTSDDLASALAYMGLEAGPEGHLYVEGDFGAIATRGTIHHDHAVVEALWRYGAQDRVWDESGNNLRKLVREARAQF